MHNPMVQVSPTANRIGVVQTLTLGFLADPMCRWTWPDAKTYLDAMPRFVTAFGGKAFEQGSAYVADNGKAAALWLPPGVDSDSETIEALFEATVAPEILRDLGSVFSGMNEYHTKGEPCWYLPLIAADPAYMSRGLGAALLKQALQRCDEDGLTAYLESTNARNLSLFERHGFEVMGKIQAGSSPTLYPMVREARR